MSFAARTCRDRGCSLSVHQHQAEASQHQHLPAAGTAVAAYLREDSTARLHMHHLERSQRSLDLELTFLPSTSCAFYSQLAFDLTTPLIIFSMQVDERTRGCPTHCPSERGMHSFPCSFSMLCSSLIINNRWNLHLMHACVGLSLRLQEPSKLEEHDLS